MGDGDVCFMYSSGSRVIRRLWGGVCKHDTSVEEGEMESYLIYINSTNIYICIYMYTCVSYSHLLRHSAPCIIYSSPSRDSSPFPFRRETEALVGGLSHVFYPLESLVRRVRVDIRYIHRSG